MEVNEDGHHLARTQTAGTPSLALAGFNQVPVKGWGKRLPKIIDMTEQFQ